MRDPATLPGNGQPRFQLTLIKNDSQPEAGPAAHWVLLDADGHPVDVATTTVDVLNYTLTMLRLGSGLSIQPIGGRCRTCGSRPGQHPDFCPEKTATRSDMASPTITTVSLRVSDDRSAPDTHVGYTEATGYAWLTGPNPGGARNTSGTVAEAHNLDLDWPHRQGGSDDKLTAIIELVRQALNDDVIRVNTDTIDLVELERVCDDQCVLAGMRVLVRTTERVTVASVPMWPSDLTEGEFGMHGALNVLWTAANLIHGLTSSLTSRP